MGRLFRIACLRRFGTGYTSSRCLAQATAVGHALCGDSLNRADSKTEASVTISRTYGTRTPFERHAQTENRPKVTPCEFLEDKGPTEKVTQITIAAKLGITIIMP